MKTTLVLLVMMSPFALAKVEPMDKLNSQARSLDRDLTGLIDHAKRCTDSVTENRAQLEGFVFATRNLRQTMECKFDPSDKCTKEVANMAKADAAVGDLRVKLNGTVYEMLLKSFADYKCEADVKTLAQVRAKMTAFLAEFERLKLVKPASPVRVPAPQPVQGS